MAKWEQVIRLFIGVALFSWALAGGPYWAYVGLFFLVTASWRSCVIYRLFNFGTYRPVQNPLHQGEDDEEVSPQED